jgi:DNA-binding CsgD family transcriptional regulator/tetratricopeptide (TPR) repeat protein
MEAPESPIETLVEALDIVRELGDHQQIAKVLEPLSVARIIEDDFERARAANDEHLALARDLGDARSESLALLNRAMIARERGDSHAAKSVYEASLADARRTGDLCVMAIALGSLGDLALRLDEDTDRAMELLDEARTIRERLGDKRNLPFAYISLAHADRVNGDLELARAHLQAAASIAQMTGMGITEGVARTELGRISLLGGDLPLALQELWQALGLLRHSEYPPDVPDCLDAFADLALASGDACSAARFLGASEELLRGSGLPLASHWPADQRAALVERVRSARSGETFEICSAESRSWSKDDAIAAALAFELPAGVTDHPGVSMQDHGLSPREVEVLRLMADGHSNQQIADELFLSLRTVTTHVTGILGKLDLPSRTAAVAFAIRNGIA